MKRRRQAQALSHAYLSLLLASMVQSVRSGACLCLTATGIGNSSMPVKRQRTLAMTELKTGGDDQGWRAIKPGKSLELYSYLTPE
ncbi:hypothetical protein ACVW0Y_003352 [Pseudomonas sp. TE3786]